MADEETPLLNPLCAIGEQSAPRSIAANGCGVGLRAELCAQSQAQAQAQAQQGKPSPRCAVPRCLRRAVTIVNLLGCVLLTLLLVSLARLPRSRRVTGGSFSSECMHPMGGGMVGIGGGFKPLNSTKVGGQCATEIAEYWDAKGGQYWVDVARVAAVARAHFENLSFTQQPSFVQVIVFDIDETVLSNAAEFQARLAPFRRAHTCGRWWCRACSTDSGGHGGFPAEGATLGPAPLGVADRPPLAPMLELYTWLYKSGYSVAFVTGRNEASRTGTEANLKAAGYGKHCDCDEQLQSCTRAPEPCYVQLFLRTMDDVRPASVYKPEKRAALLSANFTVFGNFGDQFSDLDGAPMAPHSFKLPNPGYLIL